MKTLIATFALASIVATSAVAKTEKNAGAFAGETTVACGRVVLADPDPGIRAQLRRDCAIHEGAGN